MEASVGVPLAAESCPSVARLQWLSGGGHGNSLFHNNEKKDVLAFKLGPR